jgi:Large-conductance mechanosensitive channel, MscL
VSLLGDFKKFLLRGNVVDLAVVIGTALGLVVSFPATPGWRGGRRKPCELVHLLGSLTDCAAPARLGGVASQGCSIELDLGEPEWPPRIGGG